jgi:Subtilase family
MILVVIAAIGTSGVVAALALGAAPTDPQAASQQPLQIMRVGEALDHAATPPVDVPVLVADTGLDLDHPDLAPRVLSPIPAGSDFIGNTCQPGNGDTNPDNDPNHGACSDHGSLVAGLLGAAWNNGIGGAGVAPNAMFIPFRTCWDDDQCYEFVQADAMNRAIDDFGARVVSMSWLSGSPMENDFKKAITSHPNTLFVAIPSGNGGATNAEPDANERMPCALDSPNVLCVSTSSPTDGLDCGDYGKTLVDVAVPTQNSITTSNGGGFTPTGCATSFAAPTAAGVATILFGINPQASASDVRQAIIAGARPVPDWSGKSVSGGIIDAAGAVDALQGNPPSGSDTTPPETTITKGPKDVVHGHKVKFKFESDDPGATFACKLDRGQYKSCTSPVKLKHLDSGRHKFRISSTDSAGNTDQSPAKFVFKVS